LHRKEAFCREDRERADDPMTQTLRKRRPLRAIFYGKNTNPAKLPSSGEVKAAGRQSCQPEI
jgi:hypothetical protein